MNDIMFKERMDSTQQADDILQGKTKPSKATLFAAPEVKPFVPKQV